MDIRRFEDVKGDEALNICGIYGPRSVCDKMKKKGFILLLLSIFLILGMITFFGEKGILRLLHLKKELVRIKQSNTRVEAENQKLRDEVKRLQSEKNTIEEIARGELGMVKEGEIIYQFDLPPKEKESKDK